MAISRINLKDAIQTTAARTARARTAVVRIGTVVSVSGTTVTISVGGAQFDSRAFTPVAAGDVVAVLTDTDAWWVLGKADGSGVLGGP